MALSVASTDTVNATNTGPTQTLTISSTPTAGNLLVVGISTKSGSVATVPTPTGWTEISEGKVANSYVNWAGYKIADGGETSVVFSAGTIPDYQINYAEIQGFEGTATYVGFNSEEGFLNVSTNTVSTGGVTKATSDPAYLLAMASCRVATNVSGGVWSGGFSEISGLGMTTKGSRAGISFAERLTSSAGSYEGTYTSADSGDFMWGLIAEFSDVGGGGTGVPVASRKNFSSLYNYLISEGSSGCLNDVISDWLVQEGIAKRGVNDMMYEYLGDLGYTGAYMDRWRSWELG